MKNKREINDKLIDLLLKKAEGFHYQEEQFEYERDKSSKTSKNYQNLNFFDLCDRGEQVFCDDGDKLKSANKTRQTNFSEELILVKKKVTSHYIPPDMLAIKILLEMFGKEAISDLEKMTDDELIRFRDKILKELKDENNI